ncbi:MAG: hypothetical protein EA381_01690 [Planctomycetaceae bacterium]|nr:MAG: hypothetical protein EA381_01690 [Planctomycetaceae bacterium]
MSEQVVKRRQGMRAAWLAEFGRFDRNLIAGCGFRIGVSHRHRIATDGAGLRLTAPAASVSAASVLPIGI